MSFVLLRFMRAFYNTANYVKESIVWFSVSENKKNLSQKYPPNFSLALIETKSVSQQWGKDFNLFLITPGWKS